MNREHFGKYISLLYRQGNSFLSKKYSKFGIGSGQYMFMIHLYRHDGISQERLSEILCIDKGTTAKAIKKLEEINLVERTKDLKDKRINRVFLTPKALEIKDEFFEILNSWDEILTDTLTESEIEGGLTLLQKLSYNIGLKEAE